MKLANRIIIGLVIVLLSIVVLLLISTLYYSTDKKMELGSLTDWISAGANICMAGAAVYAALNAKDWIKDKHNSAGYDHVAKLMADYDTVVLEVNRFYFDMRDLQKSDSKSPAVVQDIENRVYTVLPLEDRLKACIRFNIKSNEELEKHFRDIIGFYEICVEVHSALKSEDIELITEEYRKLDQQHDKVESFKNSLETDITKLFSFS
ncbi:hypothetical protein SMQE22_11430 [Serratia marcescens]|nr:hypothetical protein SMQE22_11430 [Serratia marcescens]